MRKLVCCLLMVVALSVCGFAQAEELKFKITHVAVDLFPYGGEGFTRAQVAPEYSWQAKLGAAEFSGFGFYEYRYRGGDFTNHSVNVAWEKLPMFALSMEQGGSSAGAFQQAGVRWSLHKTPKVNKVVGKAFNALQVTHYVKTLGVKNPNETLVGWATKGVDVKVGTVHSEGFMRVRKGLSDYGQPQFWFTPKKLNRFAFGCELEVSGGHFGWQVGTRVWLKR